MNISTYEINNRHQNLLVLTILIISLYSLYLCFAVMPITITSLSFLLLINSYYNFNNHCNSSINYCAIKKFYINKNDQITLITISDIHINKLFYFITYANNKYWLFIFKPRAHPINFYFAIRSLAK